LLGLGEAVGLGAGFDDVAAVGEAVDDDGGAQSWVGEVLVQVLDLLGLPPLGVPRLDDAPTLADLVDAKAKPAVTPPAYGTTITQPTPPSPTPTPTPVPPPPSPDSAAVGPVILRDGSTLPPPNDQPVT